MNMQAPRKVIYDTDPGVDDAMALYFAMAHPGIELVAAQIHRARTGIPNLDKLMHVLRQIEHGTPVCVERGLLHWVVVDLVDDHLCLHREGHDKQGREK